MKTVTWSAPTVMGIITTFALALLATPLARGDIAATHVYHNHMPNFWAYYDTGDYASTPVGSPIRYTYDGYVIELKNAPPPDYPYYLPDGQPMPHDDLVSYYSHHAKIGAYMSWPMDTAYSNSANHPLSQTQVSMSGAVITNVDSLNTLQNVDGYDNPDWGAYWKSTVDDLRTTHGYRALELVHFTGHHCMGPLVGDAFFVKDMIYNNATQAQNFFIGDSFRSSKGFFPTELGFSERLIPALKKFGITWSVVANVQLSRTLRDYPYLDDPGVDCMISPPNRADLQNSSATGEWVANQMFNEQQVTHNKFPFASIPHWVRYIDPETGEEYRLAAIPVEEASSWEEGYQGSITADVVKPFVDEAAALGRLQYFVIAHDGDNSQGRSGDGGTWANSGNVTYADPDVTGMGVEEYLLAWPIPDDDVVHVQDGSWIDTRDSSSDPTWYHWHLPFGIWNEQFYDFNQVHGTSYAPKTNIFGQEEGMTVSFEYGYHYLERNFALLQAALNYAVTAEQIWLDTHPDYWQPATAMDRAITYPGNQLNPWMISYPVKGDSSRDYAGGANPAELAWYFLLPAMDSGFGYYDENVDDDVKPTLSFNASLYFSEPYVGDHLTLDRTGPSVWWPQRYPYNPGSANKSKAEGWTLHYFDNTFAIYTYAYDVSDITEIQVKIRTHRDPVIDPLDKTCRVYDPEALKADPQVDPSKVSEWVAYPMTRRDLTPDMNGVEWQPSTTETMAILPAQKIGDLYYTYFSEYRGQLLDYFIEATDGRGNTTRTKIQQVYVGLGTYTQNAEGKIVEDPNGSIQGTYPFVTDRVPALPVTLYMQGSDESVPEVTLQTHLPGDDWGSPQAVPPLEDFPGYFLADLEYPEDVSGIAVRFTENGVDYLPSRDGVLLSTGTWTIYADGQVATGAPEGLSYSATVYYYSYFGDPTYMHYQPAGGTWTQVPGQPMLASEYVGYWVLTTDLGTATSLQAAFNDGAGTWDNNNGQNYTFSHGTSTLKDGTITAGPPPGQPGNRPPVADAGEDIVAAPGDTVTFDGTGSYDPDGEIVSYAWSNGLTGPAPQTTYSSTGTYQVTLTVTDDEGATGTDTVAVSIRDGSESMTTVYYKRGFETPYIHYRQADGTWTVPPGVAMPESVFEGYNVAEDIPIGDFEYLEAVFNDGAGNWDNNNGQNYRFPEGTWTFDGGEITPGAPGAGTTPTPSPTATPVPYNLPPVAVITPEDPVVEPGQRLRLSGEDSYDPDGTIVAYLWSDGTSGPTDAVSFDEPGDYEIGLVVTDDSGATGETWTTVHVEAQGCAGTSNTDGGAWAAVLIGLGPALLVGRRRGSWSWARLRAARPVSAPGRFRPPCSCPRGVGAIRAPVRGHTRHACGCSVRARHRTSGTAP